MNAYQTEITSTPKKPAGNVAGSTVTPVADRLTSIKAENTTQISCCVRFADTIFTLIGDKIMKHIILLLIIPALFLVYLSQVEISPDKQIWEVECDDGFVTYESTERFPIEKEIRMCSIE